MIFMFLFMFLFMFFFITFYQTIFMFSRHDFLSNNLHVSFHVSLDVLLHDFLSNDLHVFSSWLSIKKIMQKDNAKVGKISIFNFLDIKLEFLTSQVELTQFSIELSYVELKICVTQLKSNWKCEQLNFESSWIQNVNSKFNLMISLNISEWHFNILLLWVCIKRIIWVYSN